MPRHVYRLYPEPSCAGPVESAVQNSSAPKGVKRKAAIKNCGRRGTWLAVAAVCGVNNPHFARGDGSMHINNHASICSTSKCGLGERVSLVGGWQFEMWGPTSRRATFGLDTFTSEDLDHGRVEVVDAAWSRLWQSERNVFQGGRRSRCCWDGADWREADDQLWWVLWFPRSVVAQQEAVAPTVVVTRD